MNQIEIQEQKVLNLQKRLQTLEHQFPVSHKRRNKYIMRVVREVESKLEIEQNTLLKMRGIVK